LEETMGLIAGFFALGGLLLGLTLIVFWAGSLERWIERQEVTTDRLEASMAPAAPVVETAINPAAIVLEPESPATGEPIAAPRAA
jgi:hypothetical protein